MIVLDSYFRETKGIGSTRITGAFGVPINTRDGVRTYVLQLPHAKNFSLVAVILKRGLEGRA